MVAGNRDTGWLTFILHRMEVMLMNKNFDFKDLVQFGMFIIALLTFIYSLFSFLTIFSITFLTRIFQCVIFFHAGDISTLRIIRYCSAHIFPFSEKMSVLLLSNQNGLPKYGAYYQDNTRVELVHRKLPPHRPSNLPIFQI